MVATRGLLWGALCALLLLCSCSKPCYRWEYEKSTPFHSSLDSSRISFIAGDRCTGMRFEVLKNREGWWGYLSLFLFSFPIDGCCDDLPIAKIHLLIGDELFPYTAFVLAGRQRLLLPEAATLHIADALVNGLQVVIEVGDHRCTLLPTNFAYGFNKMEKL